MLEYYRFKDIHDLFMKGKTEEARQSLLELQARYLSICDENISLRSQVQGYEDILYLARNLIFDGSFYWLITGNIKQGPFCPNCYNRDGLLLRLADNGSSRQCITCGAYFDRVPSQRMKAASNAPVPHPEHSVPARRASSEQTGAPGNVPTPGSIAESLMDSNLLISNILAGVMPGSDTSGFAAAHIHGPAGQEGFPARPGKPSHQARRATILPFSK